MGLHMFAGQRRSLDKEKASITSSENHMVWVRRVNGRVNKYRTKAGDSSLLEPRV